LRDQLSTYVDTVARFSGDEPTALSHQLKLLEELAERFTLRAELARKCPVVYETWQDLYRFFALEAVLVMVAALLRHQRWKMLRRLLDYKYVVRREHGLSSDSILSFDSPLLSLDDHRKNRLGQRRISPSADLLMERCSRQATPFEELLQADIFLALNAVVHLDEHETDGFRSWWTPRTAMFASRHRALPVFIRAANADVRDGILLALGVPSGKALHERLTTAAPHLHNFAFLNLDPLAGFNFLEVVQAKVLTT
jgi:hypothetical protein